MDLTSKSLLPRTSNVQWRYFKILLDRVALREIISATTFAIITACVQFALFFWLMYNWPGITNWFVYNRCEEMRYISENIELNKGTASIMILSIVPSWVLLGIMASYEAPLAPGESQRVFTRPLVNFFAVIAYLGSVGVVLFDQQLVVNTKEKDRQHEMHLFSAFMLSLAYVSMHAVLAYKFAVEYQRLGDGILSATLFDRLNGFFQFVLLFTWFDIVVFLLYMILFVSLDCNDIKVYLEYVLYFGIALCNLAVYGDFVVVHCLAKLDYASKLRAGVRPPMGDVPGISAFLNKPPAAT